MDYIHEIIDFGSHVPIKFFLHSIGDVRRHWHQSIELLFVLSGTVNITVKNQTWTLKEDDVILINACDIHSLYSEQAVLAAFQIKLSMFDSNIEDFDSYRFECNSAGEPENSDTAKEKYVNLKRLLARMVYINSSNLQHREVLNKSMAYELLYELLSNYGHKETPKTSGNIAADAVMHRMREILNYMNAHYASGISLASTADHFFISQAYLSRLFKKYIGINFYDYLTGIRLTHGEDLLLTTDLSIEDIAHKSGFPNSRSFSTAFKKDYQMLPGQYRKKRVPKPSAAAVSENAMENYFDFEPADHLKKLAGYLDIPPVPAAAKPIDSETAATLSSAPVLSYNADTVPKSASTVSVDASVTGTSLRHTWRRMVSVGRASLLLYEDIRQVLKQLQDTIGYTYIKFHGIFDDDMMVYDEDAGHNIRLSFVYVDKILDFLQSIHLRPFLELGFMPKKLAAKDGHGIFNDKSWIAEPKDIDRWNFLVRQFFMHLTQRYGLEEVLLWPVCFWNEPDTSTRMFGFKNNSVYQELYASTWHTVKDIHPDFLFGSSPYRHDTLLDTAKNQDYIHFFEEHQCPPDFISLHFYPMTTDAAQDTRLDEKRLIYHASADYMSEVLAQLKGTPLYQYFKAPKYYIAEWNSTVAHRDLLNDTAYKGAYVAKNILENYDKAECFDFWTCSDIIEELTNSEQLFHGGLGMFTINNIPKPPYYAFCFLRRLGDRLLVKGPGYFVTKKGASIVGILYNYKHYSRLYEQGETFNMTCTSRYTVFPDESPLSIPMHFEQLSFENAVLTESFINKEYGSCFDQWLKMGALPLSADEEKQLKALSAPMTVKSKVRCPGGRWSYDPVLQAHEVRLFILCPDPDTNYANTA